MRPIKLFLLRHGNTFEAGEPAVQIGRQTDLPLTEAGREQALSAAAYLKDAGIESIYCGSLKRQTETAQIISGRLGAEVSSSVAALDEIDYGDWEGLTPEEISAKDPEAYRRWSDEAIFPDQIFGGSEQAHLAALEGFLEMLRQSGNSSVLAVSSGGIIRYFHSFLHSEWVKLRSGKAMKLLKVRTGHMCELQIHPQHVSYLRWGLKPLQA